MNDMDVTIRRGSDRSDGERIGGWSQVNREIQTPGRNAWIYRSHLQWSCQKGVSRTGNRPDRKVQASRRLSRVDPGQRTPRGQTQVGSLGVLDRQTPAGSCALCISPRTRPRIRRRIRRPESGDELFNDPLPLSGGEGGNDADGRESGDEHLDAATTG